MLKDFVAFQLSKDFYRYCKEVRLPRFLHEQLLRASASVVLNLAEGSGEQTAPEQRRFYAIAPGSFRECEAILEMEEVPIDSERRADLSRLGGMLFRLSRKVSTEN